MSVVGKLRRELDSLRQENAELKRRIAACVCRSRSVSGASVSHGGSSSLTATDKVDRQSNAGGSADDGLSMLLELADVQDAEIGTANRRQSRTDAVVDPRKVLERAVKQQSRKNATSATSLALRSVRQPIRDTRVAQSQSSACTPKPVSQRATIIAGIRIAPEKQEMNADKLNELVGAGTKQVRMAKLSDFIQQQFKLSSSSIGTDWSSPAGTPTAASPYSKRSGNVEVESNWMIVGVLVSKGAVRHTTRKKPYIMWTVDDLNGHSITLFLHDNAFSMWWKMNEGAAVCIANATLLPALKHSSGISSSGTRRGGDTKKRNSIGYAISVNEPGQVLKLGQSVDFGYCLAITKAGNRCRCVVNKSELEYCEFHIEKRLTALRRDRHVINQAGPGPALRRGAASGIRSNMGSSSRSSMSRGVFMFGGSHTPGTVADAQRQMQAKLAHQRTKAMHTKQLQRQKQTASQRNTKHDELFQRSVTGRRMQLYAKRDAEDRRRHAELARMTAGEQLSKLKRSVQLAQKPQLGRGMSVSPIVLYTVNSTPNATGVPMLPGKRKRPPGRDHAAHANIDRQSRISYSFDPNDIDEVAKEEARVQIRLRKRQRQRQRQKQQHKQKLSAQGGEGGAFQSERARKLTQRGSVNVGEGERLVQEKLELFMDNLVEQEIIIEKMKAKTTTPVVLFSCDQCRYAKVRIVPQPCRQAKHAIKRVETTERHFQCKKCRTHTTAVGALYPIDNCVKCGSALFESASKYRLQRGPPKPKLLLRGTENSFSLRK